MRDNKWQAPQKLPVLHHLVISEKLSEQIMLIQMG
jgi:hypothetical protein